MGCTNAAHHVSGVLLYGLTSQKRLERESLTLAFRVVACCLLGSMMVVVELTFKIIRVSNITKIEYWA